MAAQVERQSLLAIDYKYGVLMPGLEAMAIDSIYRKLLYLSRALVRRYQDALDALSRKWKGFTLLRFEKPQQRAINYLITCIRAIDIGTSLSCQVSRRHSLALAANRFDRMK
jgi:hypothetical protein